jgi:hypothetical protein
LGCGRELFGNEVNNKGKRKKVKGKREEVRENG